VDSHFYLINSEWITEIQPLSGHLLEDFRKESIEMIMFNVGAGEAILIKNRSKAIFVDGGAETKKRNVELGQSLRQFLIDNSVKLNAIVASHPHVDHLNALSTMLADPADQILAHNAVFYHNGEDMGKWLVDTLMHRLNQLHGLVRKQRVPSFMQVDGFRNQKITMFTDGRWQPAPAYKSIFMHIPYRGATFLLTGDAYFSYEDKLIEDEQKRQFFPADVLKITHHGSENGTGNHFLEHVQPAISVSSGTAHPRHRLEREVRERLSVYGGIIMDTRGARGDIIIRTDGYEWEASGNSGILYEIEIVHHAT